jgi:hypothetical protein
VSEEWGPIVWREKNVPERRRRLLKFHPNFIFRAPSSLVDENNSPFHLLASLNVYQDDRLRELHAILKKKLTAMSVNGRGVRFFHQNFSIRTFITCLDGNANRNALASPRWGLSALIIHARLALNAPGSVRACAPPHSIRCPF